MTGTSIGNACPKVSATATIEISAIDSQSSGSPAYTSISEVLALIEMDVTSTANPPISTWSAPEITIDTSAASVLSFKASTNGYISEISALATTLNASPVNNAHGFKASALLPTIPAFQWIRRRTTAHCPR